MNSLNVKFTGKDTVALVEEPVDSLKPNQVLIETSVSLISTGTETTCLGRRFADGSHFDQWVKYPFQPGYSSVGRIIEAGSQVRVFQVGDRVFTRAGHRQYNVVADHDLRAVHEALTDEEAAWGALSHIVQHGFRKAQQQLGERVVVVGLGQLGQLMVQYARVAGASHIIAIDTAPKRVQMAAAHGATHPIVSGIADARDEVERVTDGKRADVVFEMTGNAVVFAHALGLLRKQGKLILVGDSGTPAEQRLTADVLNRDLQIFGAHDTNPPTTETEYTPWTRPNMLRLFYRFVADKRMSVADLITHRYPIERAADAYSMLLADRSEAMGVILDFRRTL